MSGELCEIEESARMKGKGVRDGGGRERSRQKAELEVAEMKMWGRWRRRILLGDP